MLLTRSPLRNRLGYPHLFVARLACIRHAASVRPEPGSNSPTYIRCGCSLELPAIPVRFEFEKEFWGLFQNLPFSFPSPKTRELIRLCTPLPSNPGEPGSLKEGLRLLSFDTLFSCQGALAPARDTQTGVWGPGLGLPAGPGAKMAPDRHLGSDAHLRKARWWRQNYNTLLAYERRQARRRKRRFPTFSTCPTRSALGTQSVVIATPSQVTAP